jgi:choline-glycine betaine transporter
MEDPIVQPEMEVVNTPTDAKDVEDGDSSSDDLKDLKKDKPTDVHEDAADAEDDFIDAPMREFSYSGFIFKKQALAFNPVTSFIGFAILWSLSIWCMVDPEGAKEKLLEYRLQVALDYSWLVVVSKPISFFFLLFITYKYGHVKFGRKDEEPEYSGITYFSMLFAAGVAVGIFYFGVSEPLWHQSSHWYANSGYRSQDEIDQFAMNQTIYHWGLHAWAVYLTVAVSISLASFRFKLPLTFRSGFYPILGEYTWGWIGDVIDGFSIVVTVAGVCTSLGLGAIQISTGLQRIGWVDDDLTADEKVDVQTATIWIITLIATISVMTGLDVGIKYLSIFAFSLGMILTFVIFIMDKSSYILNLMVQTFGYYFQTSIWQLPFHTDTFGQLRAGEGRAVDGGAAADWWFDAWTIFYWNWWTSWACFVGLFVARISRGRTIFEVVFYSLMVPLMYCILWFSVWGGIGIRQARQAMELESLGKEHFNDTLHFLQSGVCYDVPQQDVFAEVDGKETLIFTNHLLGVTPVCKFDSGNQDGAAFNVLYSFSYPDDYDTGFGPFLTICFLFSVAVYFATSSDSGSLVVDFLASNGRIHHHWVQRMFWALTEGAVATALLNAGGADGLAALQAASIICGLPFTVFLLYLLQGIYEMCEQALDEDQELFEFKGKAFKMPVYGGIFNIFEYLFSFGSVHEARVAVGIDAPTKTHVHEFLQGLFLPMISVYQIQCSMYPKPAQGLFNMFFTAIYTSFHIIWIVLFAMTGSTPGLRAWGWTAYFINGVLVTGMKMHYRNTRNLHGNMIGDFLSSLIFWPQVFAQLKIELQDDNTEVEHEA